MLNFQPCSVWFYQPEEQPQRTELSSSSWVRFVSFRCGWIGWWRMDGRLDANGIKRDTLKSHEYCGKTRSGCQLWCPRGVSPAAVSDRHHHHRHNYHAKIWPPHRSFGWLVGWSVCLSVPGWEGSWDCFGMLLYWSLDQLSGEQQLLMMCRNESSF